METPIYATQALHPFYPIGLEIVGYLANDWGVLQLLTYFAAGWAVILSVTWAVAGRFNSKLGADEKACILWFVLTGSIHLFFEGYFAYNHTRMGGMQDFFGQLWKEYSLSDSRYLISDPFVLCMETITAILWGPLSFVVALLIINQHPLRYPLQALVSAGQIYGDILYYATSMFDLYYKGVVYCRPEAYYFWCYFFAMNFIWIAIPGALLYQSIDASAKAFRAVDKMAKVLNSKGFAKKSL